MSKKKKHQLQTPAEPATWSRLCELEPRLRIVLAEARAGRLEDVEARLRPLLGWGRHGSAVPELRSILSYQMARDVIQAVIDVQAVIKEQL